MIDPERMNRMAVLAAYGTPADSVCRDDEEREFYATLTRQTQQMKEEGKPIGLINP